MATNDNGQDKIPGIETQAHQFFKDTKASFSDIVQGKAGFVPTQFDIPERLQGRTDLPDTFVPNQPAQQAYWDRPERIVRYTNFLTSQPAEYKPPSWMEPDKLFTAYNYLQSINPGKDWDEWKTDDAYKSLVSGMKAPPNEAMPAWDNRIKTWSEVDEKMQAQGMVEVDATKLTDEMRLEYDKAQPPPEIAGGRYWIPQPPDYQPQPVGEMAAGMPQEQYDELLPVQRILSGGMTAFGPAMGAFGAASLGRNFGPIPALALGIVGALVGYGAGQTNEDGTPKHPTLTKAMLVLNWLADKAEQVQGMGSFASAAGYQLAQGRPDKAGEEIRTLLQNPEESWKAAQMYYEAAWPIYDKDNNLVSRNLSDPNIQKWQREKNPDLFTIPIPDQIAEAIMLNPSADVVRDAVAFLSGNPNLASNQEYTWDKGYRIAPYDYSVIAEARKRLINGEGANDVFTDINNKVGWTGQLNNLAMNMVIDPLNIAPELGSKAIGKVAEVSGKPVMAKAFGEAPGPVAGLKKFGEIVRTSLDADEIATLSTVEKWAAGLDKAGNMRDYNLAKEGLFKDADGKLKFNLENPLDYLLGLDRKSRATQVHNNSMDGFKQLIQAYAPDSPEDAMKLYNQVAGLTPKQTVEALGKSKLPRWFDSAEAQHIPTAFKDISPKVQELFDQWKTFEGDRAVMNKVGEALGVDPHKLAAELHNATPENADARYRQFIDDVARRAAEESGTDPNVLIDGLRKAKNPKAAVKLIPEGESGNLLRLLLEDTTTNRLTGQKLKIIADKFTGENPRGIGLTPAMFLGRFLNLLEAGMGEWGAKYFGVKPSNAFIRYNVLIKRMQGIALLGLNPTNFFNNSLNNFITLGWDNVLRSTFDNRKAFWDESGLRPTRTDDYGLVTGETAYGKNPIVEAGKVDDWVQGATDKATKASRKAPFSFLSRGAEDLARDIAMVSALKEYMHANWQAGKGYDRIPAELSSVLEAVQPGLTKVYENAVAKGKNTKDIERMVLGGIQRRSLRDVLPAEAVTLLSKFDPEAYDALEKRIEGAKKPVEIRQAVQEYRKDILTHLKDITVKDSANVMQNAMMKATTGGVKEVVDEINNAIAAMTDYHMAHMLHNEHIAQITKNMPWEEAGAIWRQTFREGAVGWETFDNKYDSTFLGFYKAWGVENPAEAKAMLMLDQIRQNQRAFYDLRLQLMDEYALKSANMTELEKTALYAENQKILNDEYVNWVLEESDLWRQFYDDVVQTYVDNILKGVEDPVRRQLAESQMLLWLDSVLMVRRKQAMQEATFRIGEVPKALLDEWGEMLPPETVQRIIELKALNNKDAYYREVYQPTIAEMLDTSNRYAPGRNPITPDDGQKVAAIKEKQSYEKARGEIRKIAHDQAGINNDTHIVNMVNKYSGAEYKSIVEITPEVLRDALAKREIVKAQPIQDMNRDVFAAELKRVNNWTDEQTKVGMIPHDSWAKYWADQNGKDPADYYKDAIERIGRGEQEGLQQADQPWYYSALSKTIDTMPNKMTPDALRGFLAGKVKADELKWTGFDEWLAEQKGTVTKEAAQEFMRQNQVEVKEVMHGASHKYNYSTPDEWQRAIDAAERSGNFDEADRITRAWEGLDEESGSTAGQPKFQNYTLPGGDNYRELLLTLPQKDIPIEDAAKKMYETYKRKGGEPSWEELSQEQRDTLISNTPGFARKSENVYRSSHWDEPNVLAHIRFNDRIDADGKKVLFIEEIQSDWHQAGREKGYKGDYSKFNSDVLEAAKTNGIDTTEVNKALEFLETGEAISTDERPTDWAWKIISDAVDGTDIDPNLIHDLKADGVPSAPFSKNWEELSIKRAIRYAAENGYDRVAWTTGKMQAERYDLAKQVDAIRSYKSDDGTYSIQAIKDGNIILTKAELTDAELPGVVGKELATKIISGEGKNIETDISKQLNRQDREYSGLDLAVGGEGMKAFYDQKIPNIAQKYIKKWDGKVGESDVESVGKVQSFDVTPEMRKSAMEGQPLFQPAKGSVSFTEQGKAIIMGMQSADFSTSIHEPAHVWLRMAPKEDQAIITKWYQDEYGTALPEDWMFRDFTADPVYRDAHEKFARAVERYFTEGAKPKGASPKLIAAFEKIKQFMLQIYKEITGSQIDVKLNDDLRQLLNLWMGGKRVEQDPVQAVKARADEMLGTKPEPSSFTDIEGVKPAKTPEDLGLLFQNLQPGERLPEDAVPLGTIDSLVDPPKSSMMWEGYLKEIMPLLDKVERDMTERFVPNGEGIKVHNLPENAKAGLRAYVDRVKQQRADFNMGALRHAEGRTDFALLNYGRQTNLDSFANVLVPYQFWYTRSMMNWALRAIDKPSIYANYARLMNFSNSQSERDGFPTRLKGKLGIHVPFLPDGFQDIYIDPYKQVFPFLQLARPWIDNMTMANRENKRAATILQDMVDNGEISQQDADTATQTMHGDIWNRALSQARNELDTDSSNLLDFTQTVSGWSLPLSLAYNAITGNTDRMGMLPPTRILKATTAAMGVNNYKGLDLSIPGIGGDMGEDYRIESMLANMAAQGEITAKQAKEAMVTKSGDVYIQASKRAALMYLPKTTMGAIGLDVYPEGEQKLREMDRQYKEEAIPAYEKGDTEAKTKFFDTNEALSARYATFEDDPEKRLNKYLVGEVWDAWNNLPELYRKQAQDQLGSVFTDWLNPETRGEISSATLAGWARAMNAQLPKDIESANTPIKFADKETADMVQRYYVERDKRFPWYRDGMKEAMSLPEESMKRKQFFSSNQYKEYERWSKQYKAANKEIIPWLTKEDDRLSGVDPEIAAKVYQYEADKDSTFPDIDTLNEIRYSLPESERKAFEKQYPQIKGYTKWNNQYLANNPDIVQFALGNNDELQYTRPVVRQYVLQYRASKDRLFPDIDDKWDEYFELASWKDRANYKKANPDLDAYSQWQKEFAGAYPEAAPYILSDNTIRKGLGLEPVPYNPIKIEDMSVELQGQYNDFIYGGEPLTTGAHMEMRKLWEKAGRPNDTYEAFLKAIGG